MNYFPSSACVACDVEQGIAILDLTSNTYFSLDPVGARVWNRMAQSEASLDDLAQDVAAEYDIAPETCRADVADLLGDLLKHGLIQIA